MRNGRKAVRALSYALVLAATEGCAGTLVIPASELETAAESNEVHTADYRLRRLPAQWTGRLHTRDSATGAWMLSPTSRTATVQLVPNAQVAEAEEFGWTGGPILLRNPLRWMPAPHRARGLSFEKSRDADMEMPSGAVSFRDDRERVVVVPREAVDFIEVSASPGKADQGASTGLIVLGIAAGAAIVVTLLVVAASAFPQGGL